MNGYNLFPSISFVFVDSTTWQKNFPEKELSFERCHQEISACGRRLLKGTNRSQERMRLLQWSDQLRYLMREARSLISMEETEIPESRSAEWSRMLALLGKKIAERAARDFKKEQLPLFLPGIWAPSRSGESSPADSTFESTVRMHIHELHQIKNGVQGATLEMMELRLREFEHALDNEFGVVEVVGVLLDSYLPEEGVSHE